MPINKPEVKLIHVTPKPGLNIRNPETGGYLPKDGATVIDRKLWRRSAAVGDVEISAPKKPAKKAAATKEK